MKVLKKISKSEIYHISYVWIVIGIILIVFPILALKQRIKKIFKIYIDKKKNKYYNQTKVQNKKDLINYSKG